MPSARLGVALTWVIGSVLDFLIEDTCVVCRRPAYSGLDRAAPLVPPASYLREPLEVRFLLGCLRFVNRPVCPRCSRALVVARAAGVLGRLAGLRAVETAGARFGDPDGSTPGEEPAAGPTIFVVSPFMTTGDLLKIVHSLKFGGHANLARPVARAMAWALRAFDPTPGGESVLVATPMDRVSLRRRGFNQAERIARELSLDLGIPVSVAALRKTSRTRPQSKTPREDRAANVRGAFACLDDRAEIAGKRAILVDDLVTTGATAAACSAALLEARPASVTVVCFGRAL
jgi:ComF family protein